MCEHSLLESRVKRLIRSQQSPFVFLDTGRFDKENTRSLLFDHFIGCITFKPGDALDKFFKKIERALKEKCWLAGFFSYEFGYFLDPCFSQFQNTRLNYPLAWLGVFRGPPAAFLQNNQISFSQGEEPSYQIKRMQANITQEEYSRAIKKIKLYLEQGDTYQVNFTFKVKFDLYGDHLDFYSQLRNTQPTSYMAFIHTGKDNFLSFSPELFFRIQNGLITARPMKGTINRGRTLREDLEIKNLLRADTKTQAENVMIVDLLRNDLGRVARGGGVWVPDLFSVEKYPTLFQMTSTINARLKDNVSLREIFSSLFPSGSVTGAPKIRTMQIIQELEKEERGIYTGAIGYLSPGGEATFNVAIRTIWVEGTRAEMGIGGGIVYDSVDKKEYKEAFLKANFLIKKRQSFSLIESIRWQDGYHRLDLHLQRLKKSAVYFDIPLDVKDAEDALTRLETKLKRAAVYKIRLLLNQEGKLTTEYAPLESISYPLRIKISPKKINPYNTYRYHKTTLRDFYDQELKAAQGEGFSEIIFLNQHSELTEGAISNIFLLMQGNLYTPALTCGLLPGVLRESLLRKGDAQEKVLFLDDLYKAEQVFLGNSVRGLMPAEVALIQRDTLSKI